MSEANSLISLSTAFADLVSKSVRSIVQIDAENAQARSGIMYDNNHAVTVAVYAKPDEPVTVRVLKDPKTAVTTPGSRPVQFTEVSARVVAHDRGTGIAVLKLDSPVSVPALAQAKSARVGELAVAVALPSSEGPEAKLGLVRCAGGPYRASAGRTVSGYLQTDALLFPGFAGGPVLNAGGELLGIAAIGNRPDSGLVIPASEVFSTAKDLIEHGAPQQGYLGVRTQPAELPKGSDGELGREQKIGLLVVSVEDDSPAATAGVVTGDLIVGIGSTPIESHEDLIDSLASGVVAKEIDLTLLRGGKKKSVRVTPTAVHYDEAYTGHHGGWHGNRFWGGGWGRHRWSGMGTMG